MADLDKPSVSTQAAPQASTAPVAPVVAPAVAAAPVAPVAPPEAPEVAPEVVESGEVSDQAPVASRPCPAGPADHPRTSSETA